MIRGQDHLRKSLPQRLRLHQDRALVVAKGFIPSPPPSRHTQKLPFERELEQALAQDRLFRERHKRGVLEGESKAEATEPCCSISPSRFLSKSI